MRYLIVLLALGCAPSTLPVAGSPVPCMGDMPDECYLPVPSPGGIGMWAGCGGPEWEAYEVGVSEAPWLVVGCRVAAMTAPPIPTVCREGLLACADGTVAGCGLEDTPSDDVCAAMLAACPGTGCDPATHAGTCPEVRCRYPLGWTPR